MPERLECEVLQKVRYINTLSFTFFYQDRQISRLFTNTINNLMEVNCVGSRSFAR